MKRTYKTLIALTAALVLASALPWLCSLCFPDEGRDPFVSWSPVSDSFILSYNVDDSGDPLIYQYTTADGLSDRTYTTEERDSLCPEIYTNQLMQRRAMPEVIKGREITVPDLRRNRWVFSSSPRDLNRSIPRVYPLMESMPLRFDLEDPKEAFIPTADGIEIITIATNSVNPTKTARFNSKLKERGFTFPVRYGMANITARKAYDNGYLLIDDLGQVFHMKMQAGRPSVAHVDMPDGEEATYVWVMENMDRLQVGLIATASGKLLAINPEDYSTTPLPLDSFNPNADKLLIVRNLFSWVVKSSNDSVSTWTALDPETFEAFDTYTEHHAVESRQEILQWIFPFTISWTSPTDQWVYPRVKNISCKALLLNAILALILVAWARRCKDTWNEASLKALGTIVLGVFLFIPLLFLTKHQ